MRGTTAQVAELSTALCTDGGGARFCLKRDPASKVLS